MKSPADLVGLLRAVPAGRDDYLKLSAELRGHLGEHPRHPCRLSPALRLSRGQRDRALHDPGQGGTLVRGQRCGPGICQIQQKVVPKFVGNRAKLERPLWELLIYDQTGSRESSAPSALGLESVDVTKALFPDSVAALGRMLETLRQVGFASFIESMTAALAIWPLEGSHVVACDESGSYALDCWTDYLLVSTEQLELPANLGKTLPRRESGEHQALVNFADYVGELNIGGSRLRVIQPKLDAEGFDALLRDITARCASLPFDFRSPTFIPYERAALDERDLLYHAFVYLRWAMWWAKPNLVEVLATIESDPHRMLVRETIDSPLWAVRSVGPAMLEDALRSAGRWQELPTGSQAAQFPLARRVAGLCGRAAVPTSLREHVAKTTLDTPENRFVRYFVEFLGELLNWHRGAPRAGGSGGEEDHSRGAGPTLRRELGERAPRGFLREVQNGEPVFPASSHFCATPQ